MLSSRKRQTTHGGLRKGHAGLLLLVVACLSASAFAGSTRASGTAHSSANDRVIRLASVALAKQSRSSVIRWLRHQSSVRSAGLGRDGRTVGLQFRDGSQAAILPRSGRASPIRARPAARFTSRSHSRVQATAGRAIVLEPFATQLALGPHAGDQEVAVLRNQGYEVDQAYNTDVTMHLMASFTQYNVVYIDTHSGVNQYGEGVIATGQIVNDDPAVEPLVTEGSVLKVGVVGGNNLYYGIISQYIQRYEAPFPSRALVFLNGCSLLKGSRVWAALQDKGAGVMLSWDGDVFPRDAEIVGSLTFLEMDRGKNVADAVSSVKASGYGISTESGHLAKFGYLGDGSVSLKTAANPPPTVTTPVITPAPPSPTPSPAPTSTPVPPISCCGFHKRHS